MSGTPNHCPIPKTHHKCRSKEPTKYTRSDVDRLPVSDEQVSWTCTYDYKPVTFIADSAKDKPWADQDMTVLGKNYPYWNTNDDKCKVNRRSNHNVDYQVEEYGPLNIVGRTGIRGRGCLGRWGPNHAADPIVTRWKRTETGDIEKHSATQKPILQFVAIQRRDTGEWAIPGGMVDPGERVTVTLRREFGEEALNSLEASPEKRAQIKRAIDALFAKGILIYSGYVDDPRNTDNAWMETQAYNFHDDTGDTLGKFRLRAGDDAVGVQWMDIGSHIKLYASHLDMIKEVAQRHNAHWQ